MGIFTVRSARDGVVRQSISFGTENQRELVNMVAFSLGVVETADQFGQRNGIILKRHRYGGEPQIMQFPHAGERPIMLVVPSDARPRHLEHRAQGHACRAPVQRVATGRSDEHRIHVERRSLTHESAHIRVVDDILHDRDPSSATADLFDAGQGPAFHRGKGSAMQPVAG